MRFGAGHGRRAATGCSSIARRLRGRAGYGERTAAHITPFHCGGVFWGDVTASPLQLRSDTEMRSFRFVIHDGAPRMAVVYDQETSSTPNRGGAERVCLGTLFGASAPHSGRKDTGRLGQGRSRRASRVSLGLSWRSAPEAAQAWFGVALSTATKQSTLHIQSPRSWGGIGPQHDQHQLGWRRGWPRLCRNFQAGPRRPGGDVPCVGVQCTRFSVWSSNGATGRRSMSGPPSDRRVADLQQASCRIYSTVARRRFQARPRRLGLLREGRFLRVRARTHECGLVRRRDLRKAIADAVTLPRRRWCPGRY